MEPEVRARFKELTPSVVNRLPKRDRRAAGHVLLVGPGGQLLPSDWRRRITPWSGEGYLVLCGRRGCGGRLGYVRTATVARRGPLFEGFPEGNREEPLWFPPEGFLERNGEWRMSNRSQAAYDRQRRAIASGMTPRDRHSHTPAPPRRRRPPSTTTLDFETPGTRPLTVPRPMQASAADRGLAFPSDGFRVRCPECRRGRHELVNILTLPNAVVQSV